MPTQLDLFSPLEIPVTGDYLEVPGLRYRRDFLLPSEQAQTLREVDALPWQTDLKRRVQHYGYKYDYKARSINRDMRIGELPPFAVAIARRLVDTRLVGEMPDQLIVNEYEPGQGITAHIDCEPCFKNTIVTVSLGWAYEMDFIQVDSGEIRSTMLETGSALILRDDSRYNWMHRIKGRLSDHGVRRKRRVSLTFRNVVLEP